jgi:uncharacterized protein YndB with AHSA1/START domain
MTTSDTDRIEKEIFLRAPRARVWRALTDANEFGSWFGAEMKGPFAPGARVRGRVTHPGYEHMTMDITIEEMEPERRLSWRWHPGAAEPGQDFDAEPTTLVVFELTEEPGGTRLKVVETGFDRLPLERRARALRENTEGWSAQILNIEKHVGRRG